MLAVLTWTTASVTLDSGKNFWKEMWNLGLIAKASDALHGFVPNELNKHFSNITISSTVIPAESSNSISTASSEGFHLSQVSKDDPILAVSHFRSQAKGENGISQIAVVRTPYSQCVFSQSSSLFSYCKINLGVPPRSIPWPSLILPEYQWPQG